MKPMKLSSGLLLGSIAAIAGPSWIMPADARVTGIVIDGLESPAFEGRVFGEVGQYEVIRGRVFGELDPLDPLNAIIQDIELAPTNSSGMVEYSATFKLVKPVDMSKASGAMLYNVVNRGRDLVGLPDDIADKGHVMLASGWQGDLAPSPTLETIQVPVPVNPDGSPVTGPVLVRFVNESGSTALMRNDFGGPNRYPPLTLDTTQANLTAHAFETIDGEIDGIVSIPAENWAFADCTTVPFPGTPDPTRVCPRDGFDPGLAYELVFTARDPLVLGVGLAATRDISSFFKYEAADDAGTANPVAGAISHSIGMGISQAGNFVKTFIHLGFNEDEAGRIVWDGANPHIAARQTPMNFRFAIPGGAASLYEPGSEGVLWWETTPDEARDREPAGLLDRCRLSDTCPRIFETFGSAEFWGLRMSPGLVGTDAMNDIPLPANVRRYYFAGTPHGGTVSFALPDSPPGNCSLLRNPNGSAAEMRALRVALTDWVVDSTEPPDSVYPRLSDGLLVPSDKEAMGFPDIPGAPSPDGLVLPVLDYDFGPEFDYNDLSGLITIQPPNIVQVLPTLVPTVDQDGNEIGGIHSVLHQAPLGTYLGWNVTASGFYEGQLCSFNAGFIPFARTKAGRLINNDPRPSLEERYGDHQGYVAAVTDAAETLVAQRFLLPEDAEQLVQQAQDAEQFFMISYQFDGFFSPVDNGPVNAANAGRTIPTRWRLTDTDGMPIDDPESFAGLFSYPISCTTFSGDSENAVSEQAAGNSGLQNQGNGFWQFNWQTPRHYANTCRAMYVAFDTGVTSPVVNFRFVR